MNWNPFKRLADLEKRVATLDSDLLYTLTRIQSMADRLAESEAFARSFALAKVSDNEAATAKRREYNRTYHAKKSAERVAETPVSTPPAPEPLSAEMVAALNARLEPARASEREKHNRQYGSKYVGQQNSYPYDTRGLPRQFNPAMQKPQETTTPALSVSEYESSFSPLAETLKEGKARLRAEAKQGRADAAARHATLHYKG